MVDSDNGWIEDPKGIKEKVLDHFAAFFKESNSNKINTEGPPPQFS